MGGGDDGALEAALAGQTLVMRLELALVGARGGVGALDEHGAQRAVAAPDAPGAAFAGAFVVAGTQAGPGREAMAVAEHGCRVGAHLAQDGAGSRVVDAGQGLQQAALLGPGRNRLVDVPVEVLDTAAERVVFTQQVGEQETLGFAQFQPQRVASGASLRRTCPLSEARMSA